MFPIAVLLLICLAVPMGAAWQLWRLDDPAKAGWLIIFLSTMAVLALILVVGRWDMAGLGTRYFVAGLVLGAALASLRRHMRRPWAPAGWMDVGRRHLISLVALALLAGALAYVLTGMFLPSGPREMAFPLKGGRFVIGQGGNNSLLNYHWSHRAQRYASDITAVNATGFRATGLLPRDLSNYAIFGAGVFSPCAGTVVYLVDGLPDLIPPQRDRGNARGNHIAIACGNVREELAHLRQGSVTPQIGDRVARGDRLGEVGNSGNTSEPHLHIHAVDAAAGVGVPLVFDGIVPVRNAVFVR